MITDNSNLVSGSKSRRIKDLLIKDIETGTYRDGFIPSENDLCDTYSASRTTVRKVLKQLEMENILSVAKGKGWVVKKSTAKNSTVLRRLLVRGGRFFPHAYEIVYDSIKKTAEEFKLPVDLSLLDLPSDISSYSAVLCIGVFSEQEIKKFQASQKPVILLGMEHFLAKYSISTDDYYGGYIAAEHLLSKGHRNIIIVNTDPANQDPAYKSRIKGFKDAIKNISGSNAEIKIYNLSYTSAAEFMRLQQCLKSRQAPTAIFMTTDLLAASVLGICRENRIRIPEDLNIMGYDNMVNSPGKANFQIDSIAQPWEEIGRYAFQYAEAACSNNLPPYGMGLKIRPWLVEKGSVRKSSR